jgi:riboflavin kinase/FMN adenylyltransferase
VHLLDFFGDLYGQRVQVSFTKFLRSERKFDGLDALKSQLALDIAAARAALD